MEKQSDSKQYEVKSVLFNTPIRERYRDFKKTIQNKYYVNQQAYQPRPSSGNIDKLTVSRNIIAHKDPRKYIFFENKNENNQQAQEIGGGLESIYGASSLTSFARTLGEPQNQYKLVASNPVYRYKIPGEVDPQYRLVRDQIQEQLELKVYQLERQHNLEIQTLKSNIEKERAQFHKQIPQYKEEATQTDFIEESELKEEGKLNSQEQDKQSEGESQNIQQIEEQIKQLEITIVEKNQIIDEQNELQSQVQHLSSEITELERQIINQKTLMKQNSSQMDLLEMQLNSQKKKINILQIENESLKQENSNQKEQFTDDLIVLQELNTILKEKVEKGKARKNIKLLQEKQILNLEIQSAEQNQLISKKNEEIVKLIRLIENQKNKFKISERQIELEKQNKFLVNELGRITEELLEYKRSGGIIIEKPVFVEAKQDTQTQREIKTKIEERIIYVQDKEQTAKWQSIIRDLQTQLANLCKEKINLLQSHAEEKNVLLNQLSSMEGLQKVIKPQVLREVVVEHVFDRTELDKKEQEIRELTSSWNAEKFRCAELQLQVSKLLKELNRFQTQFKLVKHANSYRIEKYTDSEIKECRDSFTNIGKSQNQF